MLDANRPQRVQPAGPRIQNVEVFEDAQSLGSVCRIGAETFAG